MGIATSAMISAAQANAEWRSAARRHEDRLLTAAEIARAANERLGKAVPALGSEANHKQAGKCAACGSHEYVRASGALICSYCRTPQSGFTVRAERDGNQSGEAFLSRLDILYGSSVLNPEMVVRIPNPNDEENTNG